MSNKQNIDDITSNIKCLEDEQEKFTKTYSNSEQRLEATNFEVLQIRETMNSMEMERTEALTKSKISDISVGKSTIVCKVCKLKLDSLERLQTHMKTDHAPKYKCKHCDEEHVNSYHLELHLLSKHKEEKPLKCDQCEAKFMLKWRLEKHKSVHQEENKTRTCHFYNNNKKCPFIQHGCKFLHKEATQCKFAEKCERSMCQFKH